MNAISADAKSLLEKFSKAKPNHQGRRKVSSNDMAAGEASTCRALEAEGLIVAPYATHDGLDAVITAKGFEALRKSKPWYRIQSYSRGAIIGGVSIFLVSFIAFIGSQFGECLLSSLFEFGGVD